MSVTLAISFLTTSHLLWFMDLTFQVPVHAIYFTYLADYLLLSWQKFALQESKNICFIFVSASIPTPWIIPGRRNKHLFSKWLEITSSWHNLVYSPVAFSDFLFPAFHIWLYYLLLPTHLFIAQVNHFTIKKMRPWGLRHSPRVMGGFGDRASSTSWSSWHSSSRWSVWLFLKLLGF